MGNDGLINESGLVNLYECIAESIVVYEKFHKLRNFCEAWLLWQYFFRLIFTYTIYVLFS